LEKETFRQYETQEVELQEDAAEAMLQEKLEKSLLECIGEEGELIQTDYVTRKTDGFLEVTVLAECSEQIGKMVPLEELPQEDGVEEQSQEQAQE
jgi:similar to stage IV sporulation protein